MSKDKNEAARWIQRIRRVERLNKDKREESLKFKKMYKGDFTMNKDSHIGKYQMRLNFVYYFVETIMPALFSGEPKIRVKPKRNPMLNNAAHLLEYNTNYWLKEIGAKDHFKDALFDSFFGPAALYSGWEYEEDGDGNATKDQPMIRWLDFWEELRVDPDCKRTRDARWMAVRITEPVETFRQNETIDEKYRRGPKKIKPTMRPEDMVEEQYYSAERENFKSDSEWVTFFEIWDRQNMERKLVHESIADDFLNKDGDLSWPFKFEIKNDPFPITILHAKQDPFSNMSQSEFLSFSDHIEERTRLRSVQSAIIRRFMPKYLYDKGAGTKEQINKFLKGDGLGAYEMNKKELFSMAPIPEMPADWWKWDQSLENDQGNVSGLSEFQQQKLANTATEATIAQGRQDVRKDARNNIFEDFVVTVSAKMAALCQQLQNKQETFMIDGPEMAQSSPLIFNVDSTQLQGEFNYDMIPGTMMHENEQLELQNLQRFIELSQHLPGANQDYLITEMAIKLGQNPKEALLTPEQKQQSQQAHAQQAQAVEQAKTQSKIAVENAKANRIQFAPIQMADVPPIDRARIINQAETEAGISTLNPMPPDIQAQVGAIQGAQGGQTGAPPQPQQPGGTILPMNASRNMAGNPNPAVQVHPESMRPTR